MSLYPFSPSTFTTEEDRRRRPVITSGQLARILVLFACLTVAMAFIANKARAASFDTRGAQDAICHDAAPIASALPPSSADVIGILQ